MIRRLVLAVFAVMLLRNCAIAQPMAGNQCRITDGARTASVRDTGSSDSLNVAIVDGSGNQVTSFGGGTQYTEADTDSSITGTALLWEDTSDTLRAVSASKPLPVSGTITCNSGSNLNTSTLALESGGNLAAASTSLSVLDDWDDSDRAKVNIISGQVGVQAGSGTVSGNTLRVVLATDVALPAGTNAIGKLAPNSGVDIGDVDITSLPNEGQQTMANSVSVAVASNQSDIPVSLKPQTSGGLSKYKSVDLDESEEEVKDTAGQVFGWYLKNEDAAATMYFKFYAADADDVTVGTTVPDLTIPVPAGSAANVLNDTGVEFENAITIACTTGPADNNSGAPDAGDCIANIFYK